MGHAILSCEIGQSYLHSQIRKIFYFTFCAPADPEGDWNEHKIDLCLWTHVVGQKYVPELFSKGSLLKRKLVTHDEKSQESSKKMKV